MRAKLRHPCPWTVSSNPRQLLCDKGGVYADDNLKDHLVLDAILCVVDAKHCLQHIQVGPLLGQQCRVLGLYIGW